MDPAIFSIGGFQLRYYGLFFALGFILSYYLMLSYFKVEKLASKDLDRLTTYIVLGTVFGARIGHVIFYQPEFFLENPFEIFMVWHGGLASHGGAIGVLIAVLLFQIKWKQRSYLWLLDKVVIPTAMVGVLIRLGNLMNSEIYGYETKLPWGFIFEHVGETLPKHPTQIYEAFCYLAIFIFLYLFDKKKSGKIKEGVVFGYFLITVFASRFLIEFVKETQVDFEKGMIINMGQLLSIPFVIIGLYFLFRKKKAEKTSV